MPTGGGGEFFKGNSTVGGGVVGVGSLGSSGGTLVRGLSTSTVHKFSQTELTCQRIQEFETQASSDLEVRNNKIDELNRASEELRHQVSSQQKVSPLKHSVFHSRTS